MENLSIDRQPSAEGPLAVLTDGCGVPPAGIVVSSSKEGYVIVRATLLAEPMTRAGWTTHDYNVHFCIGLENRGDRPIEVNLCIGAGWGDLPDTRPLLYQAATGDGPYGPSSFPARTDLKTRYAVRLTLGPSERVYLANHCPRPLPALHERFESLAARSGASRREIGRSYDGRAIVAYTYGIASEKPVLLVISGTHPPEPDTYASEAIMDWLAGSEGRAAQQKVAVAVVPVVNPDGFARRTQGANAAGVNFFWDFALDRADLCPEAATLWSLATELRPRAYIDYHGYTFQLGKERGPYVRPPLFYRSRAVRAAATRIYSRMERDYGDVPVHGFSSYAPETLGSLLAKQFDTITVAKFHLHLKHGVRACGIDGLRVFRTVLDELLAGELCSPAVPIEAPFLLRYLRSSRELWAGFLRPALGLVRRGRMTAVDFRRRATIPASGPFGGSVGANWQ